MELLEGGVLDPDSLEEVDVGRLELDGLGDGAAKESSGASGTN